MSSVDSIETYLEGGCGYITPVQVVNTLCQECKRLPENRRNIQLLHYRRHHKDWKRWIHYE